MTKGRSLMSRQIIEDWLDGQISTDAAITEGMKSEDPSVRVWALELQTRVLKEQDDE